VYSSAHGAKSSFFSSPGCTRLLIVTPFWLQSGELEVRVPEWLPAALITLCWSAFLPLRHASKHVHIRQELTCKVYTTCGCLQSASYDLLGFCVMLYTGHQQA
jgi:hypothetical protein